MPDDSLQNASATQDTHRRLDVTLVHGSVLDVTTRAVVLGSFRNVDPGGAAVTKLDKSQATCASVLEHLQSERFDVIHYAGHARRSCDSMS